MVVRRCKSQSVSSTALRERRKLTAMIRMIRTRIAAISAIIPVVSCWVVLAQPAQQRLSFEVASVKAMLVDDAKSDFVPRRSGDRITMHNAQLRTIIAWAYHLTNAEYQLVAAPAEKLLWDEYDIQALAP